jgi:hypothetical protein
MVCNASAIGFFLFASLRLSLAAHSYRRWPVFKQWGAAMDLSKLPKMSETPKPPPPEPPKDDAARDPSRRMDAVDAGAAGMLWFSLIVGALCMMLGRSFALYATAKLRGAEYHTKIEWNTGPKIGQEVAYFELQGGTAWADMGIFLFGLAMILEAISLAIVSSRAGAKQFWVTVSLGVVTLATIINLIAAVKVLEAGMIPTVSGLAVAFGGYMAMYQWKLLRLLSTGRSAPMT